MNTHCRLLIYQSPITPLSYFYFCKSRRALLTYLGPITTAIQTAISVATQKLTQFTAVRSHHSAMNLLITYHSHLQKPGQMTLMMGAANPLLPENKWGFLILRGFKGVSKLPPHDLAWPSIQARGHRGAGVRQDHKFILQSQEGGAYKITAQSTFLSILGQNMGIGRASNQAARNVYWFLARETSVVAVI